MNPFKINHKINIANQTVGTPLVGVRNATNTNDISFTHNTKIDDGNLQDGMTVTRNSIDDVAFGVVDDKTGICFGLGRGGQARGLSLPGTTGTGNDITGETMDYTVGAFFD